MNGLKVKSPSRRDVGREQAVRNAIARNDGSFKPDGCWTAIVGKETGKVSGYFQNNRAYRRANRVK